MADKNMTYEQALHAMQSGVAMEMNNTSKDTEPKHLRVGINSAMINDAALIRLLIKKGLISMDEYLEEIRLETIREVERYEQRLTRYYGKDITLG